MHNDLDPKMQARVDKWRKNSNKTPVAEVFKKAGPGSFVPRRRDYGDIFTEEEYKKSRERK